MHNQITPKNPRRIAIEVLGPEAFCINPQPATRTPQPLGETVMRMHMLAAYSWSAVTVAHYEWRGQGEAGKQAMLRGVLGL